MTKNAVINIIPMIPPDFDQILQRPNFLCIFSNQSDGGNTNGKITVRMVKLIVGAESQSIADFIATKFIDRSMDCIYNGPDIPPSFRILQKCTAMNIIATKGIAIQCNT